MLWHSSPSPNNWGAQEISLAGWPWWRTGMWTLEVVGGVLRRHTKWKLKMTNQRVDWRACNLSSTATREIQRKSSLLAHLGDTNLAFIFPYLQTVQFNVFPSFIEFQHYGAPKSQICVMEKTCVCLRNGTEWWANIAELLEKAIQL